MSTFISARVGPQPSNPYYRNPTGYVPQPQVPIVTDDYERWYSEGLPSNRMALSVRSGIHSEVGWALNRLCHLSLNEVFYLASIPGLMDSLFVWPEWYVTEGYKHFVDEDILFSPSPNVAREHRFALESLFIFRNAVLLDQNARELATHSHTLPFVLKALHNLDHSRDEDIEFLQHTLDIFNTVAATYYVVSPHNPMMDPFPPLFNIVSKSSNRTTIIVALASLTALFSTPVNGVHLKSDSPALTASIRYLPLFNDKQLMDACLNYLYAHVAHPSMARAFLFHPDMPHVLKVLASLLLHEQHGLEKPLTLDITGAIHTVPSSSQPTRDHELTNEELEGLAAKTEPQRCYDWMRTMFVAKTDGEVTQVDFWNMYKDAFARFADQYQLLVASDVIKNVNNVFPQAQAMVVPGPVQRFVVRGVDRRKDIISTDRYRCQWDRAQCDVQPFDSFRELCDHVLQHMPDPDVTETPCLWSTCTQKPLSRQGLISHILAHVSSIQPTTKHPSQSDTITLPSPSSPYPTDSPTKRPPPPPRSTLISYEVPVLDPPSTSLTALLVMRILFRTSFASAEAAPRADADHFGFPGILEETDEPPESADLADRGAEGDEREGEKRGRMAFVGIRKFLENVRLRDEALMGWITEMVDPGITESTPSIN